MKRLNIGIVGATGMVGENILRILEERNFPLDKLYLFASIRSVGKEYDFNNEKYKVMELNNESFHHPLDIVFFAAGGDFSKKYGPLAKDKGIIVIDNSSAFRMEDWVPLVIPEVNPEKVLDHKGIISNPNCSTIQSALPLKPLYDKYGLKRVVFSTYQAVSGSGLGGLDDLEKGIHSRYNSKYPYPIAYNVLPHIDEFLDNGYTKEEMKMINETKKILSDDSISITSTTVRVPVRYGHSVSANIELENEFDLEELIEELKSFPGIVVLDDVKNNIYPLPLDIEGKDEVYLGRIRRDFSIKNGLNMWIVADNTRKGAATNAVQIAELLIKNN